MIITHRIRCRLLLCLLLIAPPLLAQDRVWSRPFPADSVVATLTKPVNGVATLDGNSVNVSAALQVRDVNNYLILPMNIPDKATVRYQLDLHGLLWRVWILSALEISEARSAAARLPAVAPTTSTVKPAPQLAPLRLLN